MEEEKKERDISVRSMGNGTQLRRQYIDKSETETDLGLMANNRERITWARRR